MRCHDAPRLLSGHGVENDGRGRCGGPGAPYSARWASKGEPLRVWGWFQTGFTGFTGWGALHGQDQEPSGASCSFLSCPSCSSCPSSCLPGPAKARLASQTGFTVTPIQSDILRMLVQGVSVKEIAQRRDLSTNTVYAHRRHIMEKIGVSSPENLVKAAEILGFR